MSSRSSPVGTSLYPKLLYAFGLLVARMTSDESTDSKNGAVSSNSSARTAGEENLAGDSISPPLVGQGGDILPPQGRIGGIDFGTVRIGIAVCDPTQQWVTPHETYQRGGAQADKRYFTQLVKAERLVGFVLGLPLHCSGDESEKSTEARQFGDWLRKEAQLPVALFDERFTTAEARRLLNETGLSGKKRKAKLDGLAAHLILTHYLDSSRGVGFEAQLE